MRDDKIRICNVVCDVTSGGVESVLINYFSHIDCSKYELDLITYDIKSDICAEKFRKLGFNIIVVPPKRTGFMNSIKAMYRVIKNGKYDVVHTHLTEWNCIPMFLAWLCNVKIRISHSHMADFPEGLKKKIVFFLQKSLNKIFATKYCACGDDAAKYLYGLSSYQKGEVQILNNAIDVDKFKPDKKVRESIRKELGIKPDTFCVGHIGRFLEQKNHTFLIDIFVEVLKKKPNSCLLLLGTGDLKESIRAKVKDLGIEKNVLFLNARGDVERIYQAIDVFCLPSLFEGLPVVGVEAQAAQLPCLISDTVSDKVKMTPFVTMMSLKEDASSWASMLWKIRLRHYENSFPDIYNIKSVALIWAMLYERE